MYRQYKLDRMDSKDGIDLVVILKELLEMELVRDDKLMAEEDIVEVLREDNDIVDEEPRSGILGYPSRPLYREIGSLFNSWLQRSYCPVLDLPSYDLLDEQTYVENRATLIESATPLLEGLQSLWQDWTLEERIYRLREIIIILGGKRGLLDLLGLRKTVGSSDIWPPPRKVLEETFCAKHKPQSDSILTVGARALAKHSHRDESESWWGNCTGTEKAKNTHAVEIMSRILDNANWINIHQLPHDVLIVEARQSQGYGIRWTCDGKQFRGFLEPQMVGGHEVGWKH